MRWNGRKVFGLFIVCMIGWAGVSCRKEKNQADVTGTNVPQAEMQTSSASPKRGQVPAVAVPVKGASELDRALNDWVARNRRPPRSFEEFAATAGVPIPPAPQGRQYAIDKTGHVVLVKR
jgi:hypothetical protein